MKNMVVVIQIGPRANLILHASAAMVPGHSTQYEENPAGKQ